MIDRFLNIADKIFIGGALANNFLKAKGMDIGDSVLSENIPMKKILKQRKIYFPPDVRMKDGKIYDIGEKAVEEVLSLVQEAKFILWSGPMGNIEEDDFDKGTKIIAQAIANSKAKTVVGGGRHGGGAQRDGNPGQVFFRLHRRRSDVGISGQWDIARDRGITEKPDFLTNLILFYFSAILAASSLFEYGLPGQ